jgi:putative transposase
VYNKLLEDNTVGYKSTGKGKTSQFHFNARLKKLRESDGKFSSVHSQALQNVSKRLSGAFNNFFRRLKAGEKPGYPRFKSRVHSITYPQAGFKFASDRRLRVSKIGRIPIVKHRDLQGKVRTLTVKQNKLGQWFVVFSCVVDTPKVKHKGGRVGIDVGLTHFATLSDGMKVDNPYHLFKSEHHLKLLHRRLSRKKKGSMNRLKVKYRLAKQELKVANQRTDFLHKLSHTLTQKYKTLSIENLNIKGMVRNHCLSKHIHDAGWGMFAQYLTYKAVTCGGLTVCVNPNGTSMECNKCGHIQAMPLSQRTFKCESCGNIEDRDVNASKNILARGTAGLAETHACGDSTTTRPSAHRRASRVAETGTIRMSLVSTN